MLLKLIQQLDDAKPKRQVKTTSRFVLWMINQFVTPIAVHKFSSTPTTTMFYPNQKPPTKLYLVMVNHVVSSILVCATLQAFEGLSIYFCSTLFRHMFLLKRQLSYFFLYLPLTHFFFGKYNLKITTPKAWHGGGTKHLIIFSINLYISVTLRKI